MSEAMYDEYDDDEYDCDDEYDDDEYDCDEEYEHDYWDNCDWCYECTGYGDDYFINDEGELESACETCPHNSAYFDDDWDD